MTVSLVVAVPGFPLATIATFTLAVPTVVVLMVIVLGSLPVTMVPTGTSSDQVAEVIVAADPASVAETVNVAGEPMITVWFGTVIDATIEQGAGVVAELRGAGAAVVKSADGLPL